MRVIFLIIAIFILFDLNSQTNYNYNSVSDSLKKNVDYIVWEHKMDFEIESLEMAVEKKVIAVCVIDQYSKRYNSIYAHYRKGELVSKFKAEIYDANGNFVKKLKNNEIKDVSAVSDFSLFEDDRIMYADFTHNEYPYTLVFEYEKKVKGLLNYPDWYFNSVPNTFVKFSGLKISIPNNLKLRYKEYNLSEKVQIETTDNSKVYSWIEDDLAPWEALEMAPPDEDYLPIVYTAPIDFSEGNLPGKMDTWDNFGNWNWQLNKQRDILPETTKELIKNLVKDAINDKEKVDLIYKYMQDKTRYVSVQLGIGGYQTFPAEYVDSKGYGDCKALSNFTYALLKEIGIKAHYTLVHAGRSEDDILTDFPSNQFNHVILCVPQQKDTIWLECTNQQQPFNFLGSFTDDRHALLITEDGGTLVKTPKYGKNINIQKRTADIKIAEGGDATVKVNTSFEGLQFENRDGWLEKSVKEQKDAIKESYGVSGMEFNNLKFSEFKNEIPSIIEELDLNIIRFASTSGKRMFIKLNVFNQSSYVPKNEERTIPFQLTYEFTDIDSLQFEIPEGYQVENMPKDEKLQSKFGAYSTKIEQHDNKVIYVRKFFSEKGIFPAADYKDYYDFRKKIRNEDKAKLVLVKKV
ncbi:MAG: DUF3857 domain-containing protein [Bacteroidales bacterium]|nr:DUF3857 domain-containing protein [Bacteroidales bacterium]